MWMRWSVPNKSQPLRIWLSILTVYFKMTMLEPATRESFARMADALTSWALVLVINVFRLLALINAMPLFMFVYFELRGLLLLTMGGT